MRKDSPTKIVTYYANHHDSITALVFIVAFAMVAFAFFMSSVRRAVSRSGTDGGYLSIVAIIGAAVYIGGFLIGSLVELALADAGRAHDGSVTQTLNFLQQDEWVPVVVGLSITALATGIAGLRNHTLPRWLAWASVGLGVVALAGPAGGIAFLITPLWTLALGIVLLRRGAHTTTSSESPARRRRSRSPAEPPDHGVRPGPRQGPGHTFRSGGRGIRTLGWGSPNSGFQDRRTRPLCEPSGARFGADRA